MVLNEISLMGKLSQFVHTTMGTEKEKKKKAEEYGKNALKSELSNSFQLIALCQ